MSPILLEPENIISFSIRGTDRSQLTGAWREHDGGEMIGRGVFSGLFANSKMIFTISKSLFLESLLIRWVVRF